MDTAACDFDCSPVACGDGHVNTAAGEACDDGNGSAGDGCSPTCALETLASCKAILDAGYATGDGVYTIDPDGVGTGLAAFAVYCDMSTRGGGWTVVEKSPYGSPIGRALYRDEPVDEATPGAVRHRLSRARMQALRDLSVDLRLDCRGADYLLTDASNLFAGEGGPDNCNNHAALVYREAALATYVLFDETICTWFVGSSEGCAGAWHIDEHAQTSYCSMPNYPWTGSPITPVSGDAFATDPNTPIPTSECHQPGAVRFVMVR